VLHSRYTTGGQVGTREDQRGQKLHRVGDRFSLDAGPWVVKWPEEEICGALDRVPPSSGSRNSCRRLRGDLELRGEPPKPGSLAHGSQSLGLGTGSLEAHAVSVMSSSVSGGARGVSGRRPVRRLHLRRVARGRSGSGSCSVRGERHPRDPARTPHRVRRSRYGARLGGCRRPPC
jgi:hypothetical protein